jgi:hypothetical protein
MFSPNSIYSNCFWPLKWFNIYHEVYVYFVLFCYFLLYLVQGYIDCIELTALPSSQHLNLVQFLDLFL